MKSAGEAFYSTSKIKVYSSRVGVFILLHATDKEHRFICIDSQGDEEAVCAIL